MSPREQEAIGLAVCSNGAPFWGSGTLRVMCPGGSWLAGAGRDSGWRAL